MAGHTPTPWKADDRDGCKRIKGGKNEPHRQSQYTEIAYTVGLRDEAKDAANAAFIVKAVNMHDRLVAELDTALAFIASWAGNYQSTHGLDDPHPTHQKAIDDVQALLAEAREQQP